MRTVTFLSLALVCIEYGVSIYSIFQVNPAGNLQTNTKSISSGTSRHFFVSSCPARPACPASALTCCARCTNPNYEGGSQHRGQRGRSTFVFLDVSPSLRKLRGTVLADIQLYSCILHPRWGVDAMVGSSLRSRRHACCSAVGNQSSIDRRKTKSVVR